MSLEQALATCTAAVEALTAAVLATTKLAPAGDKTETPKAETSKPAGTTGKATGTKTKTEPAATGMTAEDLTKAIVKAVGATDKETVLGILKKDFGVSAGKEVTDPAVRQEIADKLAALSESGDLG